MCIFWARWVLSDFFLVLGSCGIFGFLGGGSICSFYFLLSGVFCLLFFSPITIGKCMWRRFANMHFLSVGGFWCLGRLGSSLREVSCWMFASGVCNGRSKFCCGGCFLGGRLLRLGFLCYLTWVKFP